MLQNKLLMYKKLFSYLPSNIKKRLILLVFLLIFSGAIESLSLASLIPLGKILLDFENNKAVFHILILDYLSHNLVLLVISMIVLFLFVIKSFLVYFVNGFALKTSSKAKAHFQKLLYSHYINAPYNFHLNKNSSEFLRNITSECVALDARFLTPLVIIASESSLIFFISLFLFIFNPLGLIIALILFLISGLIAVRISTKKLKKLASLQSSSDLMFLKTSKESFRCIKEITLYKKQKNLESLIEDFTVQSERAVSEANIINSIPRFLFEINAIIAMIIISSISLMNGASSSELTVQLGIFMAAVIRLLPSISKLASHVQAFNHAEPTIKNILDELVSASKNKKIIRKKNDRQEKLNDKFIFNSLKVEKIDFSYSKNKKILSEISFSVKKGDVVGIIGETGSGKSTLMNILLGLLEQTKGKIYINGFNLAQIKNEWSETVGYVPQDIYLLDDTVINNIKFFDSKLLNDREKVFDILEQVGLADFVNKLPEGLDTILGDEGCRLSGGQKQRIAIARSLFRNPQFIIFDEATSSLDSFTESIINESISKMKGDKTILIIAHRLSSLIHCDKIYSIDTQGRMKEFSH